MQAQQQSSIGLSQSFPSKRCGKARPWTGFHFMVQKRSVPGSSGQPLAKRPNGKKSAGDSVSTRSANVRRKEVCGGWHS